MLKPEGVYEFDGYPKPDIPADRTPLSPEKEKQLLEELKKDVRNAIKSRKSKDENNEEKRVV